MSALKDLHNRLHSRDNNDLLKRKLSRDDYDLDDLEEKDDPEKSNLKEGNNDKKKATAGLNFETLPKEDVDEKKETDLGMVPQEINLETETDLNKSSGWSKRKKIFVFGGIVLGLILSLSGGIFYVKYIQSSFKQENVVIDFEGSDEIRSGEILAKKIIVHNNNRIALKQARLKVFYPEELLPIPSSFIENGPSSSFYIDIGDLNGFESREYEIQFKVYSGFSVDVYLQTELVYQPENFSSNFNKNDNHLIKIEGSAVGFSLISAKEAASGELLKFIGILNNNTEEDFNNLILELDYPGSFQLDKLALDKVLDSENKFKITKLAKGERREIEILGSFINEINAIESLKARVGLMEGGEFSEIVFAEEVVKIIPSRIEVRQEIIAGVDLEKMTTKTGNSLNYEINFKNNSSSPLSDLILKEEITGDLIDLDSINSRNGYYDRNQGEIIWKASDVPALKSLNPGEGGKVSFSFKLKEDFIPEIKRNQIIVTEAKISSPNINTQILSNQEIGSGEKTVKVETNLDILVSGKYENSVFNNTGPVPVKVGEETTFTVKVELKNDFNKINNPKINIKLPSGINWKSSYQRSSGEVSFNERTNELVWSLRELGDFVGYEKSLEDLVFQVGVVPESNISSSNIILIKDVNFSGSDNFTNSIVSGKVDKFTLREIEDYGF
jgi:hypothetical protein